MQRDVVRNSLGRTKRYDQHFCPQPLNFLINIVHLAEVRLAGQSGEVTQKNQCQRFVQKVRKPDGATIRLVEDTIGNAVSDVQRHDAIQDPDAGPTYATAN